MNYLNSYSIFSNMNTSHNLLNSTQYYRWYIKSNNLCRPSVNTYISPINSILLNYSKVNKNKYTVHILTKYVYSIISYIKEYSYLIKFFKKLSKYKMIIKQSKVKKIYDYKTNKLIFIKVFKHLINYMMHKYNKKKYIFRKKLWNSFFLVPETFFTNKIKRKVKYIIWKVLNILYTVRKQKKIAIKKYSWKKRLFTLNYDRINYLIYKNLNKKKYSKKLWFKILKFKKSKRKNKINKFVMHKWVHTLSNNINSRRKELFFNNICNVDNKLLFSNKFFNNHNSIIKNNIGMLLFSINSNITINRKQLSFIVVYFKYLFFYNIYLKSKYLNNDNIYLKYFYYALGLVCVNIKINYYRAGVIKKLYSFSKLSHIVASLLLYKHCIYFFIDRDLNYNFVINSIFICNTIISLQNVYNYFYLNKSNYIHFEIKKKEIYVHYINSRKNIKIVNNFTKKNIEDILVRKENEKVRKLFFPRIRGFKYNNSLLVDEHYTNSLSVVKRKDLTLKIKSFLFTINSGILKSSLYNYISKHIYSFINVKKNIYSKQILKNYKRISKILYKINKKKTIIIKYNKILKENNFNTFLPFVIIDKNDQSIIYKNIYLYLKKKKNIYWKEKEVNNILFITGSNKHKSHGTLVNIKYSSKNSNKNRSKKSNYVIKKDISLMNFNIFNFLTFLKELKFNKYNKYNMFVNITERNINLFIDEDKYLFIMYLTQTYLLNVTETQDTIKASTSRPISYFQLGSLICPLCTIT